MNDAHDNATDDREMLRRFLGRFLGERNDPVQIDTVYQVSCRICGANNVEDTYDEYGDAEDARDFHRKMHNQTQGQADKGEL